MPNKESENGCLVRSYGDGALYESWTIPSDNVTLHIDEASETEQRIACCLDRIADALELIAPYFEERTIQK